MTRIPASYAGLYTEADIDEAARDLSAMLADHEGEDDPVWRAALDAQIRDATGWLAEMIEMVRGPALPLTLPIGLPAPGPVWRVGK